MISYFSGLILTIPFISSTPLVYAETIDLPALATEIAIEHGVSPRTLKNLVESESQWDYKAVSPSGDYGLTQINLKSNPDVSKAEALDPEFSLRWTAEKLAKGEEWRWTVCSCKQFMKTQVKNLPKVITPNGTPKIGSIAIFKYKGVVHYALITKLSTGHFTVKEANYIPCKTGTREVSYNDKNLVGFWSAIDDS